MASQWSSNDNNADIDGFVSSSSSAATAAAAASSASGLASLTAMMAMDDANNEPWQQYTWGGTQHQRSHFYQTHVQMMNAINCAPLVPVIDHGTIGGIITGGACEVDADISSSVKEQAKVTSRIIAASSPSSSSSAAVLPVVVKKEKVAKKASSESSSSKAKSSSNPIVIVADADGVGQKKAACHHCYHHKVKCDGKRPCQRCIRYALYRRRIACCNYGSLDATHMVYDMYRYNRSDKCIDRQYDMPLVRTRRPRRPKVAPGATPAVTTSSSSTTTTVSPSKLKVKVKKEDDDIPRTYASSAPLASRPRLMSSGGDVKDTVVTTPPRRRTRARTRAAVTTTQDDNEDDEPAIAPPDEKDENGDAQGDEETMPPLSARVSPPVVAGASAIGSVVFAEPKVKTEVIASPIPLPPLPPAPSASSSSSLADLPDDEASSTLIPLPSSWLPPNRKRHRSPAAAAASMINGGRYDSVAKTDDEYRFPFAAAASSPLASSPLASPLPLLPYSGSSWQHDGTMVSGNNDNMPDTPDSMPSSASSSSSSAGGPFSNWFRNHNVPWASTPKPLFTFDETRVVRMALTYLIPWYDLHPINVRSYHMRSLLCS
jgi:hypothetical protein